MADNPRIEELERRVENDPASLAFAQLGEEYRRGGHLAEAIGVCRAGLEHHPTYLSARVTLGRALIDAGQLDEAQAELDQVLRAAPDNLAAIRGLADLHQRRQEGGSQSGASGASSPDAIVPPPLPPCDLATLGADAEFARALETLDALPRDLHVPELPADILLTAPPLPVVDTADSPVPSPEAPVPSPQSPSPDPVVTELEAWLAAIQSDRARRAAAGSP